MYWLLLKGDGNKVMDYFTWFGCIELWKVDMVIELWKLDMISNLKKREVHLGLVLKVDSQGHNPIMGRSQLICTEGSLMVTVQYSNDYKDDKNEALHTQYIFCTDVPYGGPAFHAVGIGSILGFYLAILLLDKTMYTCMCTSVLSMMISQAAWIEVLTQLATLTAKVSHMKGGVRTWMDRYFEAQDRRVQGCLDSFESRITQQFGSGQTPNVADVRAEIAEIKTMVTKLYERPVVAELDHETRVREMAAEAGGLRATIAIAEGLCRAPVC
ncbi:hypothetical protein FXO37_22227 [Capsicum annuum]|nr:hypothetical protein FXO37_22227 [Capsicum annuum]